MVSVIIPELIILLAIGILLIGPKRAGKGVHDFYEGLRQRIRTEVQQEPSKVAKKNNK
jgi:Sec-independent protein translocase protein TatA